MEVLAIINTLLSVAVAVWFQDDDIYLLFSDLGPEGFVGGNGEGGR